MYQYTRRHNPEDSNVDRERCSKMWLRKPERKGLVGIDGKIIINYGLEI
jgi:hypothetical protein